MRVSGRGRDAAAGIAVAAAVTGGGAAQAAPVAQAAAVAAQAAPAVPHGLTGAGAEVFSQDSRGMPGKAERNDHFGAAVAVLAGRGAQAAQVLVGDPDENGGDGALWIMPTSTAGPRITGTASFGPGTLGAPATKAAFGTTLTGR